MGFGRISPSHICQVGTNKETTFTLLQNVLGCDVGNYAGDVAYLAADAKLECEGKAVGKCNSKISIPIAPGAGLKSW